MTKVCRRNRHHHPVGATRCEVCNSLLVDSEELDRIEDERLAAERAAAIERERRRLEDERKRAEAAAAEAKRADDRARAERARLEAEEAALRKDEDRDRGANGQEVDDDQPGSRQNLEPKKETFVERVEDAVEGDVVILRQKIAALVERAFGHEGAARRSAATAAEHARAAATAASEAEAHAAPNASAPGFGEAAGHAQGAGYHAAASQTAADEAASHAAAASQARQTVETLAANARTRTTASGLQQVIGAIEDAVARVADFADKAKAALERAQSAAGEATALGGFFMEALKLWRALRA